MAMPIECYAQRLLNPFRGTMQVIKHASAEAVSTDGVHWGLYVSNEELMRGLQGQVQISDIRYGSWSVEHGLKRGPIYPSDDFRRMERLGAIVFNHLTHVHEQLPFPLRDSYEFWLLDEQGMPLALLDSALAEQGMTLDRPVEWRPGMAARERFHSPAAVYLSPAMVGMAAADYLADYLHQRAGTRQAAQRFHRNDTGVIALQGVNLADGWVGRYLETGCFPDLLIGSGGHDACHSRLIEDFHAWQAVWLLTLPMSTETRACLEAHVRRQATLVEGICRLYPEIIDVAAINAARVEALILKAQGEDEATVQDPMSTFYIELNPAGGTYT